MESMIKNKHAYLIIAHNKFEQLAFLVSLLDYKYHDIYILVDKKSNFSAEVKNKITKVAKESNIYFSQECTIHWGGYSQIEAEMKLFSWALESNDYSYFHLLSGVDLPLASNDEIYSFFEANPEKIFLSLVSEEIALKNRVDERVKYAHYFSNIGSRSTNNKVIRKAISLYRKLEITIQKALRINRLDKYRIEVDYASNWLSIDLESTQLLVKNQALIKDIFYYSVFGDEIFIPTMINKLNLQHKIYSPIRLKDQPEDFQGNLRYINWWDGALHTWTDSESDKAQLLFAKKSGHFFSRKFDLDKYPSMKSFILELTNKGNAND